MVGMGRYFTIRGPCVPADHYMLLAMARLPQVLRYIDRLARREDWLVVFDPKLGDWDAKLRHEDVELEDKTIQVFFC